MVLIKSKRYPEYFSYSGPIHHTSLEAKITRFSGLDSMANEIINNAVEGEVYKENGKMLEVLVYYENSWYGIIPTYTITVEFKWYLPGEFALGIEGDTLLAPAIIASILWSIAGILAILAIVYYTKRRYDAIEQHGYPPWYESIFGKITLVLIAGAGAYAVVKLTPYLYKKVYKQKKT